MMWFDHLFASITFSGSSTYSTPGTRVQGDSQVLWGCFSPSVIILQLLCDWFHLTVLTFDLTNGERKGLEMRQNGDLLNSANRSNLQHALQREFTGNFSILRQKKKEIVTRATTGSNYLCWFNYVPQCFDDEKHHASNYVLQYGLGCIAF